MVPIANSPVDGKRRFTHSAAEIGTAPTQYNMGSSRDAVAIVWTLLETYEQRSARIHIYFRKWPNFTVKSPTQCFCAEFIKRLFRADFEMRTVALTPLAAPRRAVQRPY